MSWILSLTSTSIIFGWVGGGPVVERWSEEGVAEGGGERVVFCLELPKLHGVLGVSSL